MKLLFIIFFITISNCLLADQRSDLLDKIREADAKVIALQPELLKLNDAIVDLQEKIISFSNNIAKLNNEISDASKAIAALNDKIAEKRKILSWELKSLIMIDKSLNQKVYLTREFFINLIRNDFLLNDIRHKTAANIDELVNEKKELTLLIATKEQKITELEENEKNLKNTQASLLIEQKNKLILSSLIEKEKEKFITQAELLDNQFKEIRADSKGIAEKNSANDITLLQPAIGKLIQDFGAKKAGDIKTYANGVLIALSDKNDTVVATAAGKVFQIVSQGAGLYSVSISHKSNLLSLYGLLTNVNIAVGDEVETGQKIGSIDRDNIIGGKVFYFELRSKFNAVNPKNYLKDNAW